jgi:hypothetical protein
MADMLLVSFVVQLNPSPFIVSVCTRLLIIS